MAENNAWDTYWSQVTAGNASQVLWDVDPADPAMAAGARDLERIVGTVDASLPFIDFGCGDGHQTRFLAKHLKRVIGTDHSQRAIDLAQAATHDANVSYRVLDGMDRAQARQLHAEIGDANVYLRLVLQQIAAEQRATFALSLAELVGKTGMLYLWETSPAGIARLKAFFESNGKPPPPAVGVFQAGIKPGFVTKEELTALFPPERFSIVREGEELMPTTHHLADGTAWCLSGHWQLIKVSLIHGHCWPLGGPVS